VIHFCDECQENTEHIDDGSVLMCTMCETESEYEPYDERDDPSYDDFSIDFADPGGRSALRAETPDNPRILPCPNCGSPNRLTPKDRELGYQCDSCADAAERGVDQ
jgi:hypothetical protein